MANTTNLGLELEALNEHYSIERINDNLERIDGFAGEIRAEIQRLWDAVAALRTEDNDE